MKNTSPTQPRSQPILDRSQGCLLGGAIGDALGASVEFMSGAEITKQFGPGGIQEYAPVFGRICAITDDTQMTLFTAEDVVRSWVRAFVHSPCGIPGLISMAYQRWLHTQGLTHPMHNHCLNGWLITHQNLFKRRRAPGSIYLSGLQSMEASDDVAKNDSKGCGGIMRVAPVGMYFATLAAKSDANKSDLLKEAFATGCRSAAITHGHPTGQLASGAFAAIIMQLLTGTGLELAINAVLPLLATHPDHEETTRAIEQAYRLAKERPNDVGVLGPLGGGWIAEEALAIALYCALSAADFRSGVVLAVNHGGDSDSTGSMAGQLLGAMYGAKAIPVSWRPPLELGTVIEAIAYDLAKFGDWGSGDVDATDEHCARHQDDSLDADAAVNADTEEIFDPLDGVEFPVVSDEDQERYAATELSLSAWEETFRAAAKADDFQLLQTHLRNLELPDEPGLLLDGTILLVQMSVAYLSMDNQQVAEFLAQQKYDPTQVSGAPYQVTFDIHGKAYARINVPGSLRPLDLADLYGTPWNAYERVGYSDFWISRVDGKALSAQEIVDFENAVESDLRFDYGEDEVTFWFDPDTHDGVLKVTVQDVCEYCDDDEDQFIETTKDDSLSADGNEGHLTDMGKVAQQAKPSLTLINSQAAFTVDGIERMYNALTGKSFSPQERVSTQARLDAHFKQAASIGVEELDFHEIDPVSQTGKIDSTLLKEMNVATKKTPEQRAEIIVKALGTGRMANTLAKALGKRYSYRWQFVDFLGPAGQESAGVVDIVAIRKSGVKPAIEGLKSLDLFDIILIQVKGGSAGKPKKEDVSRLRIVKKHYCAQAIVLFEWNTKKSVTRFSVLDDSDAWTEKTSAQIFGKPGRSKTSDRPVTSAKQLGKQSDAATKAWVTRKSNKAAESK